MIKEIEAYFDRLWPICRSITGDGLRESFEVLKEIIPLELEEVPSGTPVLDWVIPDEWNISEAYLIDPKGNKIVDIRVNNLHIVNYSIPFEGELTWEELQSHLHYKEDQPDAIPYVTSYYNKKWGFCLSHNQFKQLPREGRYQVVIKSTLKAGSLTYGEKVIEGSSKKEVLFTSYLCHPSMANNELSGPLTLAFLYKELSLRKNLKYTYRFVLAPETIGALAYLDKHGEHLKGSLMAGYIFTCCGDKKAMGYKYSRQKNSVADNLANKSLGKRYGDEAIFYPFVPVGSDERQYCSPGFNLPVGSFVRSKYHDYKEYHTSLDDKSFISFESLEENVRFLLSLVEDIESLTFYKRVDGRGEPNMGKRNLYQDLSKRQQMPERLVLRMSLLNFCDGILPIQDFINNSENNISDIKEELELLEAHKLIVKL